MGNSQITTRVDAELGASKLDSIIKDGALDQLRTELDATIMSVKVAILNYATNEGPQSISPNKFRLNLDEARTMVRKHCLKHKHTGLPCDLIIFQTLTTPADYVCVEEPHAISVAANQTFWHDQLKEMLCKTYRFSQTAMPLASTQKSESEGTKASIAGLTGLSITV